MILIVIVQFVVYKYRPCHCRNIEEYSTIICINLTVVIVYFGLLDLRRQDCHWDAHCNKYYCHYVEKDDCLSQGRDGQPCLKHLLLELLEVVERSCFVRFSCI